MSTVGTASAVVTRVTDEPADALVAYGPTSAYGRTTLPNRALSLWHAQTLSGLSASTTYHFMIRSQDQAGNLAVSRDYAFTTGDQADAADHCSEVDDRAPTLLFFTNPGSHSATMRIDLMDSGGLVRTFSSLALPAMGSLKLNLQSELFPGLVVASTD